MSQEDQEKKEVLGDRMGIIQEATQLYLEDETSFTIHNLAKKLEVNPSDIYAYFPNKRAILDGYYTLLIDRYRMMVDEIEDFESYDLAEKLSNFIYTNFDMMMENRAFVEETFETFVIESSGEHPFHNKVKKLFKEFFAKDSKISSSNQLLMQDMFYDFLVQQYFHLVMFWLQDASDEFEKSLAYTDKITSFLQEVMYTSVLDKGMDLFKFMITNDPRISRIPIVGSLTRKIFK